MPVDERYRRNIAALSPAECELLHTKTVCVAGCGGLGGYVIETLARSGVGALHLVDGDVFEESNLNRQLLCTEQALGRPKAEVAAERVRHVNSDVAVAVHHCPLDENNAAQLIAGSDCVVDALDSTTARFWLAHACQTAGIPLVYGAIAGWFGQVSCIFPGDVGFAGIYGSCEGEGVQEQEGNLACTAACTAAFQSAEALKVLVGRDDVLRNRLLMIDLLYGSCEQIELR